MYYFIVIDLDLWKISILKSVILNYWLIFLSGQFISNWYSHRFLVNLLLSVHYYENFSPDFLSFLIYLCFPFDSFHLIKMVNPMNFSRFFIFMLLTCSKLNHDLLVVHSFDKIFQIKILFYDHVQFLRFAGCAFDDIRLVLVNFEVKQDDLLMKKLMVCVN